MKIEEMQMNWSRRSLSPFTSLLVALAAALVPAVAGAQSSSTATPSAANIGKAYALFNDAKALMEKGMFVEACPKFEESDRLNHGTGTLFALAECHEKLGRLGSAWEEFTAAAVEYRKAGNDAFAAVARERANDMISKASKLVIRVSSATKSVSGLQVTRDGSLMPPSTWDSPFPVDPGAHMVVALAPGKKSWQISKVVEGATVAEVVVPPLEDAPMPSRRVGAFVAGGVGIAGIALGTVFGVLAINGASTLEANCPSKSGTKFCTNLADGEEQKDAALTFAGLSTAGFVVGGVGLAAGTILLLTAPKSEGAAVKTGLQVAPGRFLGTVEYAF